MRTAWVTAEWGEVVRNGRKIEGWAWEVQFRADGVAMDRHCYKTEDLARDAARRFEAGDFRLSEWGGVKFD